MNNFLIYNLSIAELKSEKQDLKRLLKEDANEVSTSNVPLYTLQIRIDESLKHLREKLQNRRNQIQVFLDEQNHLCSGKEEK